MQNAFVLLRSEIIDSMVQLDIDRIQSSLVIVSPFTDPGSTQPSVMFCQNKSSVWSALLKICVGTLNNRMRLIFGYFGTNSCSFDA